MIMITITDEDIMSGRADQMLIEGLAEAGIGGDDDA